MKKGKKMPSIELEGHSDARFVLKDGKIVRIDASETRGPAVEAPERHETTGPQHPGR